MALVLRSGGMLTLVVGMWEAAETVAWMVLASMATTSVATAPGSGFDQLLCQFECFLGCVEERHRGE